MSKTLKVISPLFSLKQGDVLELTKDGKYTFEQREEFNHSGVSGGVYDSAFSTKFSISQDCAKDLIEEGYLEEYNESQKFVNVFEEIDNLLDKYVIELKQVERDEDDVPACLRVEKTTVLNNMIKLLKHLKGLKK